MPSLEVSLVARGRGEVGFGLHEVLRDTYAAMAEAPGDVDLDALYVELGVREVDGEIVFDDAAPLAQLRQQITRP